MHVLWQVVKVNQQTTITSIDQVRWIPLSHTHQRCMANNVSQNTAMENAEITTMIVLGMEYTFWDTFFPTTTNQPRLVQFFLVYNININIVWERSRIKKMCARVCVRFSMSDKMFD